MHMSQSDGQNWLVASLQGPHPSFRLLQVTESWAGPGSEASRLVLF